MSGLWWLMLGMAVGLLAYVLLLRLSRTGRRDSFERARRTFHLQRERLEAKFIQLATSRSRSKVVHWDDCEFDDDVAYVRNRATQEVAAFVAVSVAVEEPDAPLSGLGGEMRVGTAIFRFDRDHWETDGRAILNLNPAEAIRVYRDDLEMIAREPAEQS